MDTHVATISSPPNDAITESDVCAWLGAAAPGDRLAYHRGFLPVDCDATNGRLTKRGRGELLRVARRAMRAAEAGLVHLVQRRNGPGDYSYILVARPRPTLPEGSLQLVLGGRPE